MGNDDYTDVRNTVILALGFWAGAVALGTQLDVFTRLPGEVFEALAVFAVAFAVSAVTMDVRLRAWLDRRPEQCARLALVGIAGLLVAAVARLAGEATAAGSLAAAPWAPVLLFGAPLTAALCASAARALGRAAGAALRRPASKAPARRPAAT